MKAKLQTREFRLIFYSGKANKGLGETKRGCIKMHDAVNKRLIRGIHFDTLSLLLFTFHFLSFTFYLLTPIPQAV